MATVLARECGAPSYFNVHALAHAPPQHDGASKHRELYGALRVRLFALGVCFAMKLYVDGQGLEGICPL